MVEIGNAVVGSSRDFLCIDDEFGRHLSKLVLLHLSGRRHGEGIQENYASWRLKARDPALAIRDDLGLVGRGTIGLGHDKSDRDFR